MKCIHGVQIYECNYCWKLDQFDVCSTCCKKFKDESNRSHIQNDGMCLSCEHSFGDILSSRADEQFGQEVL